MKYVIKKLENGFPFYIKGVDPKQHALSVEVDPQEARKFDSERQAELFMDENGLTKGFSIEPLIYTWQQLKDAANSLTPEQLANEVKWWGDERGGTVEAVQPLSEEYILSDEGWEPTSCFSAQEIVDNDMEDSPRLAQGTPILWVD